MPVVPARVRFDQPASLIPGAPTIDVDGQDTWDAALRRLNSEVLNVVVRPRLQLIGGHYIDLAPDPTKRSVVTTTATTQADLPKLNPPPGFGLSAFFQGATHLTWDGFSNPGEIWGIALGRIGGTNHPIRPVVGLNLSRQLVSSKNEAAVILAGNSHDFTLRDVFVASAGREAFYVGYGNPSSTSELDRCHGFSAGRIEAARWGQSYAGAEAFDWKPGSYNFTVEDYFFHDGRTFSQGVVTAPGPNNVAWGTPGPKATFRRGLILHVVGDPTMSPLDCCGFYVATPGVTIEDLIVADVQGAGANQGREVDPGMVGQSTITRMYCVGNGYGPVNPQGWGDGPGGWPNLALTALETDKPPAVGQGITYAATRQITAPAGAPSSWTYETFRALFAGGTTPEPPQPPPTTELAARVAALETKVAAHESTLRGHQVELERLDGRLDAISQGAEG